MKRYLLTGVKLVLVAALLGWLVQSEKLDFRQLRVLVERPEVTAACLSVWVFGTVGIGSWRWWLLLRGVGLRIPFVHAFRLQLIGLFFNTALPAGTVGGDLVKAVYVVREQRAESRAKALLTVFLDRLVGLFGLFTMAAVAIATEPQFFFGEALHSIAIIVLVGLGVMIVGATLVFLPTRPEGEEWLGWLWRRRSRLVMPIRAAVDALRLYRRTPLTLVAGVVLTIVMQGAGMAYALYLTRLLTGGDPTLNVFATVYSVGTITTAVPLAPGGLGVGHAAFARLFEMVGLTGGANVFNVLAFGQLALNLVGLLPYLLYKRSVGAAAAAGGEITA
jgi:uncharacterized protein (TIRG00374 family)